MRSSKVWFITGTPSGFGRVWTEAALKRGDKVVATARNVGELDELVKVYGDAILVLPLDVADRESVIGAVARAQRNFGRLDVIVSNAGYGYMGAIEELGTRANKSELRHQCIRHALGNSGRAAGPEGARQRPYFYRIECWGRHRFSDGRNLYGN